MQNNKLYAIFTLLSAVALFASCNPVSKAIRTLDKNQPAAALYCATRFPAKDSLIKGDTITLKDTVTNIYVDTVSVDCPPNTKEVITIKAPCPPGKTIYVTRIIHDTIIRVDRARETVLMNANAECQTTVTKVQKDYEGMKDKRDKWRLWFWILLGAAGAYAFLKVKKILPFVFIPLIVFSSCEIRHQPDEPKAINKTQPPDTVLHARITQRTFIDYYPKRGYLIETKVWVGKAQHDAATMSIEYQNDVFVEMDKVDSAKANEYEKAKVFRDQINTTLNQ